MSLLPIRLWPDPVLARRAEPVTAFDASLRLLADDMLETMYAAPGRGLAAPQVGVLRRLFVMDVGWKEGTPTPLVIVNPVLSQPSADTAVLGEGCLSIPEVLADVRRPAEVTLDWQDLEGQLHSARLTGFAARCAQHEADHLDGVLTLDRLDPGQLAALEPALERLRQA
jgi:peptide deformylase